MTIKPEVKSAFLRLAGYVLLIVAVFYLLIFIFKAIIIPLAIGISGLVFFALLLGRGEDVAKLGGVILKGIFHFSGEILKAALPKPAKKKKKTEEEDEDD